MENLLPEAYKTAMQREILLFAALRDAAGTDSLVIDVGSDATAADVICEVAQRVPSMQTLLASCRVALDSRYVANTQPLGTATEIAIIPPVSGG
ncbi:MoaD/ThiS family protein [Novipirellula caenicola]|uniref:Molybdopterin synthase sulfur carrier subunit n=1 Tax=Novipirellula caenicola TaxID=1536901 RepID=A0ABP9VSY4_9BACT